MQDKLIKLMNHGFIIYDSEDGKVILQKICTPKNPKTVFSEDYEKIYFNNFSEAFEEGMRQIGEEVQKKLYKFSGSILYNRGLGPEIKNIEQIITFSIEEAKKELEIIAEEEFPDQWIEVKIRPTGEA